MDLFQLIPLLEPTCRWDIKRIVPTKPQTILAGQTHNIYRFNDKDGYMLGALIAGNNPLTVGRMRWKSLGQERQVVVTPQTLQNNGLTLPNGSWWNSVYDTVTPYYVVTYVPYSGTQLSFHDFFEFDLIAPAGADVTISSMSVVMLIIPSRKEFWRRVRAIHSMDKWLPTDIEFEKRD